MPVTITMPKLSPTMTEGTIVKWHKKEGDYVKDGDLLFEVGTDKATVEYHTIEEGYLRKCLVLEGKTALVNDPVAILAKTLEEPIEEKKNDEKKIEEKKEEKKNYTPKSVEKVIKEPLFVPEEPLETIDFNMPNDDIYDRILASPLAKRLAKEKGLDLSSVKGTGPHGRILSRDLDLAQKDTTVTFGQKKYPKIFPGSYEEEELSQMRKAIARRLQEAKMYIPHFYLQQEIDAKWLLMIKEELKNEGINISINDLIIRATALALKEHPDVNSGFNSKNQTLIRFKTIDISVAVSINDGLITPIIRYADYKNIGHISVEMKHLIKKAKENKLKDHEYKGGSITVSNLGMYGIDNFTAILNPPQAAILAVGAIRDVPVIIKDKVKPGKVMTITLSCDHRVIDGALAAQFIKTMQKFLESPILLLVC